MKTCRWPRLILALSVLTVAFAAGCANKTETPVVETEAPAATPPPEPVAVAYQMPTQKVPAALPTLSPGIGDVVKLTQANLEESVVISYVETSPIAYDPTADEILYLKDLGVSPNVITALIRRGQLLRESAAAGVAAATNAPAPEVAAVIATNAAPAAPVFIPPPAPAHEATKATVVVAKPSAIPTETQVDVNVFYDALAPYGAWLEVPDYGWVWQPAVEVSNPEWQPYVDGGHWLYTDLGWYWTSDYTWGWAPFHYGRWFRHPGLGWLWVPDSTWGPAWVCWRRTPLYCGWAPLPPAAIYEYGRGFCYYGATVGSDFDFGISWDYYVFIHYQHFCDPYPRHRIVDRPRSHDLHGHSTVHNRYILGPNRAIINQGVDVNKVTEFSRVEFRKINVREMPAAEGRTIKPDRVQKDGDNLVIYRAQPQHHTPVLASPITRPEKSAPIAGTKPQNQIPSSRTVDATRGLENPSRHANTEPTPVAATPRTAVATPAYMAPESISGSRGTTATTPATTPLPSTTQWDRPNRNPNISNSRNVDSNLRQAGPVNRGRTLNSTPSAVTSTPGAESITPGNRGSGSDGRIRSLGDVPARGSSSIPITRGSGNSPITRGSDSPSISRGTPATSSSPASSIPMNSSRSAPSASAPPSRIDSGSSMPATRSSSPPPAASSIPASSSRSESSRPSSSSSSSSNPAANSAAKDKAK